MKTVSLGALALTLGLAACGASRSDVEQAFGGAGALLALESAAEARGWLLDPEHGSPAAHEPDPAGYPALEGPETLPSALAERLGRTLGDPGTYLAGSFGDELAKGCLPRYGLRLQFRGEATTVDVVVCFECSLLLAYRDGAYASTLHFDPGRRRLAQAASEAFPSSDTLKRFAETP